MKKVEVNGETFYKDKIGEIIKYSNWSPKAFVLGFFAGMFIAFTFSWAMLYVIFK